MHIIYPLLSSPWADIMFWMWLEIGSRILLTWCLCCCCCCFPPFPGSSENRCPLPVTTDGRRTPVPIVFSFVSHVLVVRMHVRMMAAWRFQTACSDRNSDGKFKFKFTRFLRRYSRLSKAAVYLCLVHCTMRTSKRLDPDILCSTRTYVRGVDPFIPSCNYLLRKRCTFLPLDIFSL